VPLRVRLQGQDQAGQAELGRLQHAQVGARMHATHVRHACLEVLERGPRGGTASNHEHK
jgi:hypothetical protein